MIGAEVAGLQWIAALLSSVAGGTLTDRLKRRESPEEASKRALRVYVALSELRQRSTAFVDGLRSASRGDAGGYTELRVSIDNVFPALYELVTALKAIDPQLEIHEPTVSSDITGAARTRGIVVSQVDEELERHLRGEPADLASFVPAAEDALAQVEQATENLRAFLASEFTFKESF